MIRISPVLLTGVAILLAAPVHAQQAAAPAPAAISQQYEILDTADFAPEKMLPPPPEQGSALETLELKQLRSLIGQTSADRMKQAQWDDLHEDPAIFDAVLGVPLQSLPMTWALLKTVQNEGDVAAAMAKRHFNRTRPWGVDPTLPNCDTGKGKKPNNGYPSGHSTLGYSVGFVLAHIIPAKATAILARAQDYALSRQICGVHFASDTEASHVIGSLVAHRLLASPKLADRIAQARIELAAATKTTTE